MAKKETTLKKAGIENKPPPKASMEELQSLNS